ncbi:MAG: UPF0182 family protein [Brevinema sp.]
MNKMLFLLIILCCCILSILGIFTFSQVILEVLWFISQGFIHTVVRFLLFRWLTVPIFAIAMSMIMLCYLFISSRIPKKNFSIIAMHCFVVFVFSLIFEFQTKMTQDFIYAALAGMTEKQDLFAHVDFSFYLFWFPVIKNFSLYAALFFMIPVFFYLIFIKKICFPKLSMSLSVLFLSGYLILNRLEMLDQTKTGEYISFLDIYAVFFPFVGSVMVLALFLMTVIWIFRKNYKYYIIAGGGVALLILLLNTLLPYYLDHFIYKPNQSSMEITFSGIFADTTRKSFNLDTIIKGDDFLFVDDELPEILSNNFWNDKNHFVRSIQKNQEIFPIFAISNASPTLLSFDQKILTPSFLAARNIIENPQDNWDIKHFRNIFGYSAVIGSATEFDNDGNPKLFLKDLQPNTNQNISLNNPQLFFSDAYENFIFVNSTMLIPDFSKDPPPLVQQKFKGITGISANFFVRFLMMVVHRDLRFFLTDYITKDTLLILKRKPKEIIGTLLPMFHFDDAHLVYNKGELWWALDGYSVSDKMFLSKKMKTPWGDFNWIRSPIKAYVSAYTGEVAFQIMDAADPYVNIARYLFPRLFEKKIAFASETYLYPDLLFKIQSELLTRFHDTDNASFYAKLNIHEIARPLKDKTPEQIKYLFLKDTNKIAHQHTYTPKNKNIFAARLLGFVDEDKRYRLHYYASDYSYGIAGLAQAEAFLNQDQEFSRLTTLWDQRGSKVSSSDTVFYPMKDKGIYLRTVFLESEGISIPLVTRFVAINNAKSLVKERVEDLVINANSIAQSSVKKESKIDQLKASLLEAYQYYIQAQSARISGNVQEYNENVDNIGKALQNADL